MNGSGWTFHSIVSLDIHTVRCRPLRGGTYVKLPKYLASKKALINMKFINENKTDNQCFKWCIARTLNPVKDHPERITGKLEEQAETLNFKNISFPVKLRDINKFEKQYPTISLNVLGYDDDNKKKIIYPMRISEMDKREHEVNLLLLEDKHYVLINNMSRLLTSKKTKHTEKRHFCLRCLNSFTTKEVLKNHNEYCQKNGVVKVRLRKKGQF